MAKREFDRFSNIPDSKVPIQGKYIRHIKELAKAFFRIKYRNVQLNRKEWRFDISVVDSDDKSVEEFQDLYPMCHIENTFSELALQSSKSEVS